MLKAVIRARGAETARREEVPDEDAFAYRRAAGGGHPHAVRCHHGHSRRPNCHSTTCGTD